jgi:hypothetical protein
LFYVYRLFGEMAWLYVPSKLNEVLAWKAKVSGITKKRTQCHEHRAFAVGDFHSMVSERKKVLGRNDRVE